jgi:protein-S-isoprenylcysteine O-methyltransferase Ste14
MPPWYLPLLLLVVFWWLAEAPLWKNRQQSMRPSADDRSTIWVNTILGSAGFVSSLGLMPWARTVPSLRLESWIAWGGLAVAAGGIVLRRWSLDTLGRFHTGTLQVQADQEVVERGPYRLLRHPSYLGGDIALFGVGMTTGSWPTALLMVLPFVTAHVWRIRIEERMMERAFGDRWRTYSRRTWRMIPYLW